MFELTLLFSAISVASVYVLASYGLIVIYRVGGVFNFALGFQGAFAAFLYWQVVVDWGLNKYVGAILVVFVSGPLVGLLIQQVLFRRRRDVLTAMIVTIGLGVAISGLIQVLWPTDVIRTAPSLFGEGFFRVAGTTVTHNNVGVAIVGVVMGGLVWLLLNASKIGIAMRAVVDDPQLAEASGIPSSRVNGIAWMVGSVLVAAAGVLVAPLVNLQIAVLSVLVVNAFAVVAFAGMSRLSLVLVGSLVLAYVQELADKYQKDFDFIGGSPRGVVPFVALALVLLLHPAVRTKVRVVGDTLQARQRERAHGAVGWAIFLAIFLAVIATMISPTWTFTAQLCACYAIAALSLVLLVGGSAQISLCQIAFMGLSAVVMGKLLKHDVPWGIALIGGSLAASVAGLLVALTAFRLRGLFLALATYAFGFAMLIVLFQNDSVIGVAGLSVPRPSLFGIDFSNERSFLAFLIVIVVVVLILVGALLRGPWGRALQTLSAGDTIAEVSGLPVRQWKMAVFALSAGLAGLAGGLFASTSLNVSGETFAPEASLTLLVLAVVGGVTTPAGAVIAGTLAAASAPLLQLVVGNAGAWSLVLFGVMAMQVAIMYPAGYGGLLPRGKPLSKFLARRSGTTPPQELSESNV
jgi:branched-chain amino acid transport system permease protein